VQRLAIHLKIAKLTDPNVHHAANLVILLETLTALNISESYPSSLMLKLRVLQANLQKSPEVQHNLLNDSDLRLHSLLLIQEPHCHSSYDHPFVTEQFSRHWDLYYPSLASEFRYPYRSVIWAKKRLKMKQIPIPSSDITAVQVTTSECTILAFSVYIPHDSSSAEISRRQLSERLDLISTSIHAFRN
jgi:hypothetical protein